MDARTLEAQALRKKARTEQLNCICRRSLPHLRGHRRCTSCLCAARTAEVARLRPWQGSVAIKLMCVCVSSRMLRQRPMPPAHCRVRASDARATLRPLTRRAAWRRPPRGLALRPYARARGIRPHRHAALRIIRRRHSLDFSASAGSEVLSIRRRRLWRGSGERGNRYRQGSCRAARHDIFQRGRNGNAPLQHGLTPEIGMHHFRPTNLRPPKPDGFDPTWDGLCPMSAGSQGTKLGSGLEGEGGKWQVWAQRRCKAWRGSRRWKSRIGCGLRECALSSLFQRKSQPQEGRPRPVHGATIVRTSARKRSRCPACRAPIAAEADFRAWRARRVARDSLANPGHSGSRCASLSKVRQKMGAQGGGSEHHLYV